jgi:hypothetical protein
MKIKLIFKIITIIIITFYSFQLINVNIYAKNTIIKCENEKENWVVIMCGGVKNDSRGIYNVQINTTNKAYNKFKTLGYDDEHIYFLQFKNPENDSEKLPNGADGFSNKSNAKYALENWLASKSDYNDNCFIYLADHGSYFINLGGSVFYFYDYLNDKEEYINGSELNEWIDKINYSICTVFIDACYSGGFIKHLSKENRIIMTSSKLTPGVVSLTGDFSQFFFEKLNANVSYGTAWEYAGKKHLQIKIKDLPDEERLLIKILARIGILIQSPQIDDNGDKMGSGRRFIPDKLPIRKDGFLALQTYPSLK